MQYTVYLEVQDNGTTMAHVPSLPGCVSTGATQEMALARTPDAIAAYLAWLRSHLPDKEKEAMPPENTPIEIVLGGTHDDPDTHLGDEPGLLPPDRAAIDEAELGTWLRLLAYSRRDLLDLISNMPREVLRWQPQTEATADAWCIDDILEHLARAERVYTSRFSSNVYGLLDDARRATLERISRLTEQERSQVTEQQGEYWTARKVLRRLLEHEHEHYLHIQQVLRQYSADQGVR